MGRATRLCLSALAGLLAGASVALAADAPPKFDVKLTLSPAALKKLAGMGEQVTVAAMYSGEPTKAGEKKAIEGEINLGEENVTRKPAAATTYPFVGKGFKSADLKWVKPGTARMLINVYSARMVADDNLLECELWNSTLDTIPKPLDIGCRLIDE
jgi:hypothetical protein